MHCTHHDHPDLQEKERDSETTAATAAIVLVDCCVVCVLFGGMTWDPPSPKIAILQNWDIWFSQWLILPRPALSLKSKPAASRGAKPRHHFGRPGHDCLGGHLQQWLPSSLGGLQTGGVWIDRDHHFGNQPAQITGTEAEPQQIVAQGLLSCLQYHVP